MARAPLYDLSKVPYRGLWVNGSKESTPVGALRRNRSIHQINTLTLRSRWGTTELYSIAAHSLYRFNGIRFQGAGTDLYAGGISVISGLNGNRLTFLKMPPSLTIALDDAGIPDYLFVAGGGLMRKIDQANNVTKWGIDAPPDGFTASANAQSTTDIDLFESAVTWTATDSTLTDEASIKQEGTNAMKMVVAKKKLGVAKKNIAKDLTAFSTTTASGATSSDQDFISFWIRVDHPEFIETAQIAFDVGDNSFNKDFYVYRFPVADSQKINLGINDFGKKKGKKEKKLVKDANEGALSADDAAEINNMVGVNTILTAKNTWIRLKIPKISFTASGLAGQSTHTWANVAAVKFEVKTNSRDSVTIYLDALRLLGGAGLIGDYKYHVTFLNESTGSRSNSNPTAVEVLKVDREEVAIANLPLSADAQVTAREIWRTVGNGALFFRIKVISDNTTTTFTDNIVEFDGLDTRAGIGLMEDLELPTTNLPPESTYNAVAGPFLNRAWWCGDTATGAKGRLYYSPEGLPESVEGYIQVTNDDDPTQIPIVWNSALYVLSKAKLFQITGTEPPFVPVPIFGAPGTSQPFTGANSPFGIPYQAADGIRLFNGIRSDLIGFDQIGVLFRGEASENLTAFEGVVGAYHDNEYIISDGVNSLALNLQQLTWRDLGVGMTAIFEEADTKLLIASFNGKVGIFEDENVLTDFGDDISLAIEFPSLTVNRSQFGIVQMVYLDINCASQVLTPSLVLDDVVIALPPINGASRQIIEYPVDRSAKYVGFRIEGNVNAQVEVFPVDVDVHIGANS